VWHACARCTQWQLLHYCIVWAGVSQVTWDLMILPMSLELSSIEAVVSVPLVNRWPGHQVCCLSCTKLLLLCMQQQLAQ
jgi:hypothetical protein